MNRESRVLVVGHETLIGRAVHNLLRERGCAAVFPAGGECPDMHDARAVDAYFAYVRPEFVFVAGGKSGGIAANQAAPADLMLDNLALACNAIESARRHKVKKLLFLGSSCAYPKQCPQPMKPEHLMTGHLEPTSEPYAMAKLAGITMCRAYRRQYGCNFVSAIPADCYGPGDDFDREKSHVLAAIMRKMHDAKTGGLPAVELWGTGSPKRDFIFSADLADACVWVMDKYEGAEPINLGCNQPVSISDLAAAVKDVVGYGGKVVFDRERPDGMPVKWLDATALQSLGWRPSFPFKKGLALTYEWFLANAAG